ncbi:MAG: AN1-type zinc finger domain-containing protein [Halobacterium sp.]
MGECDRCEGDDGISYTCNECGGTFCSEHRLPEAHRCEGLLSKDREEWFKDELSVRENRQSESIVRDSREGDVDESDASTASPTCLECGRITERECEDCGTPYCKQHVSPRVHNCAFLDVDSKDTSWNPHDGGNPDTPPKPDVREQEDDGGLLRSLLSVVNIFR